jgi:hypothetical protein
VEDRSSNGSIVEVVEIEGRLPGQVSSRVETEEVRVRPSLAFRFRVRP